MPHYSVKPLHLALRPSRLLAVLLIAVCMSSMTLTALMPLPFLAQIVAMLVLAMATVHAYRQHAGLASPHSITLLEVGSQGHFRCFSPAQEWRDAEVLGSSFVTPWLTVLNLRLPDRRLAQHVVLLPDAVEHEAFRRLRVWLRWGLHD